MLTEHFDFRNPPRWARMLIVAVFACVPGVLFGGLIALWTGHFVACVVVGAGLAATAGAVCEN